MIKMEIKGLLMDPVSNMPVVILRDTEKGHFLPIWVGIFEANAIALEMEKVSTPRPMTHDLLKNLLAELDARVERVVINDLRENTFFARIHLTAGGDSLSVDSRPSDAIALALRSQAEIFVEEDVLEKSRNLRAEGSDQDPDRLQEVARGGEPGRARQVPDVAPASLFPNARLQAAIRDAILRFVIISITNQKGGVGKTTTAINLAAAMAQKGMKTLLIDLDPQGNSTMSYLDRRTVEKSMFDVLTDPEIKLKDIIRPSGMKNLDIAPARISLAKIESKLLGEIDGHFRLRDKIDAVRRAYDAILIDTPPTLGMITVNAMVASTPHPDPDPVLLLRPRGHRRPARDDRQDQGPPESRTSRSWASSSRSTTSGRSSARTSTSRSPGSSARRSSRPRSPRACASRRAPRTRSRSSPSRRARAGAAEYYSLSEEVLSRV